MNKASRCVLLAGIALLVGCGLTELPPVFPPLSGSKVVQGAADGQIGVLLNGRPGTAMVSFARLSDSELAAVISYTRNSWENNTGKIVQPSDIKALRKS